MPTFELNTMQARYKPSRINVMNKHIITYVRVHYISKKACTCEMVKLIQYGGFCNGYIAKTVLTLFTFQFITSQILDVKNFFWEIQKGSGGELAKQ
jgi:hypothetical protein